MIRTHALKFTALKVSLTRMDLVNQQSKTNTTKLHDYKSILTKACDIWVTKIEILRKDIFKILRLAKEH